MIISRTDGYNVCPAADIALAIIVAPRSYYGTVGFQAYSVISACADGHNVFPVTDLASVVHIIPHTYHCTVGFQSYGMISSCADGINVLPGACIAPAILVVTHSNHRTIGFYAYGMIISCADKFPHGCLIPQCKASLPFSQPVISHSCFRYSAGFLQFICLCIRCLAIPLL